VGQRKFNAGNISIYIGLNDRVVTESRVGTTVEGKVRPDLS
jgi:hypothetical protein